MPRAAACRRRVPLGRRSAPASAVAAAAASAVAAPRCCCCCVGRCRLLQRLCARSLDSVVVCTAWLALLNAVDNRIVGIAIARARAGTEIVRHARRDDAHRLAGVDARKPGALRGLIGAATAAAATAAALGARRPSRAPSCALRAPWARIVGMPGGRPKLVTIIEPGRVATWVWPAPRTVMSLPNTKVEIGLAWLDVEDGDAAADADGAGRRRDGDRRCPC